MNEVKGSVQHPTNLKILPQVSETTARATVAYLSTIL